MLKFLFGIKGIPNLLFASKDVVIMEPIGTPVALKDRAKSFKQIVQVLREVHEVFLRHC